MGARNEPLVLCGLLWTLQKCLTRIEGANYSHKCSSNQKHLKYNKEFVAAPERRISRGRKEFRRLEDRCYSQDEHFILEITP